MTRLTVTISNAKEAKVIAKFLRNHKSVESVQDSDELPAPKGKRMTVQEFRGMIAQSEQEITEGKVVSYDEGKLMIEQWMEQANTK